MALSCPQDSGITDTLTTEAERRRWFFIVATETISEGVTVVTRWRIAMGSYSWRDVFTALFFLVYFIAYAVTGLGVSFASWPLILAILALFVFLAIVFRK